MKHILKSFNKYIKYRVFKRAFIINSLMIQLFKRATIHENNIERCPDKRVRLQK